ncbi:MAG: hypothetical protein LBV69_02375 [Bacteroidales bacterium]|jgi:hypothetical protein|nr:hypothetical protein [Bacteroidales bacterium]
MKKIIYLVLAVMLISGGCKKEEKVTENKISGVIVDSETLEPIYGVKVQLGYNVRFGKPYLGEDPKLVYGDIISSILNGNLGQYECKGNFESPHGDSSLCGVAFSKFGYKTQIVIIGERFSDKAGVNIKYDVLLEKNN